MKSKSKETGERWQTANEKQENYPASVEKDCFKIINISKNTQIHSAINNTLKFFSLNGKKLCIYKASTIEEGISLLRENPCVILIMIDNTIHVNGSYHQLESFIQNELEDSKCVIAFKRKFQNAINKRTIKKSRDRK
ncbi:MAG: hypothetical protein R2764_04500 [Bacteroidales bacterium]